MPVGSQLRRILHRQGQRLSGDYSRPGFQVDPHSVQLLEKSHGLQRGKIHGSPDQERVYVRHSPPKKIMKKLLTGALRGLSFCRFLLGGQSTRRAALWVSKKSGRRTAALQDAGALSDTLTRYR